MKRILTDKCTSGRDQEFFTTRDVIRPQTETNLWNIVVIAPGATEQLQEFVAPMVAHPLTKLYLSQIGLDVTTRGGPGQILNPAMQNNWRMVRSHKVNFCEKPREASGAHFVLAMLMENVEKDPEDVDTALKTLRLDGDRQSTYKLLGLEHGPLCQTFQNNNPMGTLNCMAILGKAVFEAFKAEPSANHGVRFVSPLSFITAFSPTIGRYVQETPRNMPPCRSLTNLVFRQPHMAGFYHRYFNGGAGMPALDRQIERHTKKKIDQADKELARFRKHGYDQAKSSREPRDYDEFDDAAETKQNEDRRFGDERKETEFRKFLTQASSIAEFTSKNFTFLLFKE